VAVRAVGQLGEYATRGGFEYLDEGVFEGSPCVLCERLGLARQRFGHHLRYGLLRSHRFFSFLRRVATIRWKPG
jgi:hypothetical protein